MLDSEAKRRAERAHLEKTVESEFAQLDQESLVEKYKPQFLGAGGEQVVFEFPNHPNIVAKVHKHILAASAFRNIRAGLPLETLPKDFEEGKKRFMEQEKEVNKDLKRIFGRDSVLAERPYGMFVPVTKELMQAVVPDFREEFPEGVHQVYTLVRLQERAPEEALDQMSLETRSTYLEMEELDAEGRLDYELANETLLDDNGPLTEEIIEQVGRGMEDFIEELQQDDSLKGAARDFVERAIRFTNETGEQLDLAGEKNAVFYKNEDEWKYLLIDAKYPNRQAYGFAQRSLEKFNHNPHDLSTHDVIRILNALTYTRTLNLLAKLTDSKQFLRYSQKPLAPRSRDIYNVINSRLK